jgi:hypothetical protein
MTDRIAAIDTDLLLSRRRLIQAGGAATAVLYLGGLTSRASAAGVPSYLTRAAYIPLTDAPFDAATATGMTRLRLTAISDLTRAAHDPSFVGRDDAFALLFSGPPDSVLDSGVHELRNPDLGAFSVFISPVQASGQAEQHYEVVVDRSVRLASAIEEAPRPLELVNSVAPEAAIAAAPVVAGAPAAAPAVKSTATKKSSPKRARLVRSATLARRGGILTADVRVAGGHGLVSVRVALLRDGVEHARAARRLKGRLGVRLDLREVLATPPGEYTLRVTVTDRDRKRTASRHRVTVR